MKTQITKKTHWKKNFDYNYLGSYSLNENEELILTIKSIKKEKVLNPSTNKKEEKVVCYFEENQKPMILNSTNHQRISKLIGSPYIEDWIGQQIIIVTESIRAFGEDMEALRVKMQKPEKLDLSEYENQLMSCESLEDLKNVYLSFSVAVQKGTAKLKNDLKNKLK